nr:hypothetical protein [Oscillospiraceae bacterium]
MKINLQLFGGRGGESGPASGKNSTNKDSFDKRMKQAKESGAFEIDWYESGVQNAAISVATRSITATPESIEKTLSNVGDSSKSIEEQVKSLKDSHVAFEIGVPKYSGTEKQVKYANNLAEAYLIHFSSEVSSRWEYRHRNGLKEKMSSMGLQSGNDYVEYMVGHSSTLKSIQSTRDAGEVISILKGKVNPNNRAYNNPPFGYQMRKGRKF